MCLADPRRNLLWGSSRHGSTLPSRRTYSTCVLRTHTHIRRARPPPSLQIFCDDGRAQPSAVAPCGDCQAAAASSRIPGGRLPLSLSLFCLDLFLWMCGVVILCPATAYNAGGDPHCQSIRLLRVPARVGCSPLSASDSLRSGNLGLSRYVSLPIPVGTSQTAGNGPGNPIVRPAAPPTFDHLTIKMNCPTSLYRSLGHIIRSQMPLPYFIHTQHLPSSTEYLAYLGVTYLSTGTGFLLLEHNVSTGPGNTTSSSILSAMDERNTCR